MCMMYGGRENTSHLYGFALPTKSNHFLSNAFRKIRNTQALVNHFTSGSIQWLAITHKKRCQDFEVHPYLSNSLFCNLLTGE